MFDRPIMPRLEDATTLEAMLERIERLCNVYMKMKGLSEREMFVFINFSTKELSMRQMAVKMGLKSHYSVKVYLDQARRKLGI